ncbi:hypothetical protein R3P38DRAFT_2848162, partial [Favolaschia claudopus]
LEVVFKLLTYLMLVAEYSATFVRTSPLSQSEKTAAYDEAPKRVQKEGLMKLPATTFVTDVLPWFLASMRVIQEADTTNPVDIYTMAFAVDFAVQSVCPCIDHLHKTKGTALGVRASHRAIEIMQDPRSRLPPGMSRVNAPQPQDTPPPPQAVCLGVGDILNTGRETFEVLDVITSTRTGTSYIVANLPGPSPERRLTEKEIDIILQRGAVVNGAEVEELVG